MPNNDVYIVITDGWKQGYGASLYCVGIFMNKKEADEIKKKYNDIGCYSIVEHLKLNKHYPMYKAGDFDEYCNEKYIGGYIE